GSAYKNRGVQLLLDAIGRYLPSPPEVHNYGTELKGNQKIEIMSDPKMPLVAMAFKITDDQYGQLTYTRIYQGTLNKGDTAYNPRMQKRQRIGRIVRMHAAEKEEVD